MCSYNSCGLEKTAHNILLYKLKFRPCQHFITDGDKLFLQRVGVDITCTIKIERREPEIDPQTIRCDFRLTKESERSCRAWCPTKIITALDHLLVKDGNSNFI